MSNSIPPRFQCDGLIYWKDYFPNTLGFQWSVIPTRKMKEEGEIYGLSRSHYVGQGGTRGKGQVFGEPVSNEVFFDEAYVLAYFEQHRRIIDLWEWVNVDTQNPVDLLSLFEEKNGINISPSNPRQSLYLKYKEFVKCLQQQQRKQ